MAGRKGDVLGSSQPELETTFRNLRVSDQQQTTTNPTHAKYNPVVSTDLLIKDGTCRSYNTKCHCITHMKEYEDKSLEELRLEDYTAGRKGGAAGEILKKEDASKTSALAFNFGIAISSFGISTSSTYAPALSSRTPASRATAGSSKQQNTATNTTNAKYNPVVGTDVDSRSRLCETKSHCITLMKEYEDKSLEELRLEDYTAGRKGGAAGGADHQNTATNTTNAKYNPVVSTDVDSCRQLYKTKSHCITVMKEYEDKSLEELRLEDYTAGRKGGAAGGSDQQKTATTAKYNPVYGTDVDKCNRQYKTKFVCITVMKEYEDKSLEELRLEDYTAGRKGCVAGRSGQKQTATGTASAPSNTDSRCSTSEEEKRRAKDSTSSKKIPKEEKAKRTLGSCPLCFDDYSDGQPIASTTCGHVFCQDCLKRALDVESKCPTCRNRLTGTSKYHAIYL